jgi:uncharacterized membrane protein
MSELIAIGYLGTDTAHHAAREAKRLAKDLSITPDAIAVIVRRDGEYKVTTNRPAVAAAIGVIVGKMTVTGVDEGFQSSIQDLLTLGTSALFLVVEQANADETVDALAQYGGTVLKTSLTDKAHMDLQDALHGSRDAQAVL